MAAAFKRGLKEAGYAEGQNVAIEYRWADDQNERLPALAADLVNRRVDVIFANSPSIPAALAATKTIPIIFNSGDDPVRLGFVASLNRPGGNATGVAIFSNELAAKRLELLRELVPNSKSIAVLINSDFGPSARFRADVEKAARALGLASQFCWRATQAKLKQLSIASLKPALTPSWSAPVHFWTATAIFWWPALHRPQFQRHMKLARARWPAG